MKTTPRMASFFTRARALLEHHGHWAAVIICLALMMSAAAWLKTPAPESTAPLPSPTAAGDELPGTAGRPNASFPAPTPALSTSPPALPQASPVFLNATENQAYRPIDGPVLTEHSPDTPVYNATLMQWRTHPGIDLAGETGAPVRAAAAGTVATVEDDPLYGLTVVIDGGDGAVYAYAGLHRVAVRAGDAVTAGESLGTLGMPPFEADIGAHLHFEVWQDGESIDPQTLLWP